MALGQWEMYLPVKASGTSKGSIDVLRPVRSGDNDDVVVRGEAVHKSEKLGNNAARSFVRPLGPLTRYTVDLIEKDGSDLLGSPKRAIIGA